MTRRLTQGDEQIWRNLSVEAIETHPECFVTTAKEERAIPLSWFREEIGQRIVLTSAQDSALAVLKMRKGVGNISSMYVRPDARRRGLAGGLLTSLHRIAETKGCQRLALQVFEDNSAAIGLYRKHGFDVDRSEPFHDRVNCRMTVELNGG